MALGACALVALLGLKSWVPSDGSWRSMLETLTACAACVAAAAFWVEARQTQSLRAALVCAGIGVLGLVDIVTLAAPAAADHPVLTGLRGAPTIAILFTALFFVSAACVPRLQPVPMPGRLLTAEVGLVLCFCALSTLTSLSSMGRVAALGETSGTVVLAGSLALFVVALGRLLLETSLDDPGMTAYLAGAATLLSLGIAERLFVPWAGTDALGPSVASRLAAFTLLALYGWRRLTARRRETQRAAAGLERNRLARDLHDGLCQDLAFIAANADRLAGQFGDDDPVVIAARRALALSRDTLADLAVEPDSTVSQALQALADELAPRFGVDIDVHALAVELPPPEREDIVRIAREATVNAVKHGGASRVTFRFDRTSHGDLILRVIDDGSPTESPARWHEGFGMASMRRRAAMLGASLDAHPGLDGGTELEVVLR